jgi:hypothetical protein
MTRIRFLTSVATNLRAFEKGDEADWADDKDARRLCEAGHAERVKDGKGDEGAAKRS